MNEYKIVGLDKPRKLLILRSVLSKEEFKHATQEYGGQYQFGLNYQTFKYSKHSLKHMTGMTSEEYDNWDAKFNKPCEK